ncbi:low specificity L-threonine aldolase [Roseivirga sp. BDSF3-8]|uniref:threonine aldolase family protein n=1 Tax=Roseivirga sp. BDSF3-8 TaxID=3241598 RepID=UPI0035320E59
MNNRRDFLKTCSLSAFPLLMPVSGLAATLGSELATPEEDAGQSRINFIYDDISLSFSPADYIKKLEAINKENSIQPDIYGNGGVTQRLEEEFAAITGKEKAIYLPTGTMANQVALKLLSGDHTKVFVPENSHTYRDEADAAQTVHSKRLIPVGKGKPYFTAEDLQKEITYLQEGEVFRSGMGAVAIENPVRRENNTFVPLEVIKEVAAYCQSNGLKLHLDGARLHIASAYAKVPVAEYCSYFDTVYISLYKYLNATGGAILCGEAELIDQVAHQIKIFGGTAFHSWPHTAMALHYLKGIDERWQKVVESGEELIRALNGIEGVTISRIPNGTNAHRMALDDSIDLKKMATYLDTAHQINIGKADSEGIVGFTINESIHFRSMGELVRAFKDGVRAARV